MNLNLPSILRAGVLSTSGGATKASSKVVRGLAHEQGEWMRESQESG